MMYVIIALVLLLVLLGLVYFIGFSGKSAVEPTGGEAEDSSGGDSGRYVGGGSGPSSPPTRPPTTKAGSTGQKRTDGKKAKPTKATRQKTTVGKKAKPTKATTRKPTPSTTSGPPPPPPMLVCTFGKRGVLARQVPEDGLCDSVFYMHIYYDKVRDKIKPLYGWTAYKVLRSVAKTYKTTTFGTSMFTDLIAEVMITMEPKLERAVAKLFGEGFKDLGMLDVDIGRRGYDAVKANELQYFKEVEKQVKNRPGAKVALSLRARGAAVKVLDAAQRATRDFPCIGIVIIQTHASVATATTGIYRIAPNPDESRFDKGNTAIMLWTLRGSLLKAVAKNITKGRRKLLLSMAMYANVYRANNESSILDTGNNKQSLIMDYRAVCFCPPSHCENYADPMDSPDNLAYRINKFTFVYLDDTRRIENKAKNRMEALSQKGTGIAAYNIEMDDFDGTCGKAFDRLRAIKAQVAKYG
ncbi:uncharacterized protein [Dermacentor albipictus]|uniref:uncharacterized protein n=1 Tax=Dermacentor albipictus TaxID=60249 RepID=UPI0031FD5BFD